MRKLYGRWCWCVREEMRTRRKRFLSILRSFRSVLVYFGWIAAASSFLTLGNHPWEGVQVMSISVGPWPTFWNVAANEDHRGQGDGKYAIRDRCTSVKKLRSPMSPAVNGLFNNPTPFIWHQVPRGKSLHFTYGVIRKSFFTSVEVRRIAQTGSVFPREYWSVRLPADRQPKL